MNILHIAPNAPYNDNWGYQENLLPKYQKKAGHDVSLIVTNLSFKDGKTVETECREYVSDDGVNIIRLKKKQYPLGIQTKLCAKLEVYPYLEKIKPDLVFYHGLHGTTVYDAVKYKKKLNPNCVIVQDNHMDPNNGMGTSGLKNKLLRAISRRTVRKTMPYISRVYGVTPWRKKYAEEYYGVPSYKTDVLIMGADDEQMNIDSKEKLRGEIRAQYEVDARDFLVVTGGKIDRAKQIHLLMEACGSLSGVKLLIFGKVSDELSSEFEALLARHKNIVHVGWIEASQVYKYFFAADLVVFPGGHSVMWEQACASKTPCVFRKWEGIEHLNNGGNCRFVSDISVCALKEEIQKLCFTPAYYEMKAIADSKRTDVFLYSHIAKKSVECAE